MSLRVAVTRAEPGASRTADAISARGGIAILAPLLEIKPEAQLNRDVGAAQALVFTSANGVRAFGAPPPSSIPVFAVGAVTAAVARAAGFSPIRSANGDVADLAALIGAALEPEDGPLLHVSGADIANDLAIALAPFGFAVERRIAYRAEPVGGMPAALAERLGAMPPALDAVLFHSSRAATTFAALAVDAATARLAAACLSQAVAAAARTRAWDQVIVAERPQEGALLNALFADAASRA